MLIDEAIMSPGEWISCIAVIIQGLCVVAGAVWAVSTLRGTGNSLQGSINHLSNTINKLETKIDKMENNHVDHEVRLRLAEQRIASSGPPH